MEIVTHDDFEKQYEVEKRELGSGSFGKVFRARQL